jgi:CBS domain-containing protein
MKERKVVEILLPFRESMPIDPSVPIDDKTTHAVELMVKNNLKRIAVVRNRRPIGMIRLEDAFKQLGIQIPRKK